MANGTHTAQRKTRQAEREQAATTEPGEFTARIEKDMNSARLYLRTHYRPASTDQPAQNS